MSRAATAALLGALLLLLATGSSVAQQSPRPSRVVRGLGVPASVESSSSEASDGTHPLSLRARVGVEAARRLLKSTSEAERLRGLRRLGSAGTAPALELMIQVLDEDAEDSGRSRLVIARALAPHAHLPNVRQALVRVMTGAGNSSAEIDPLQQLAGQTAALALAASRSAEALSALAKALRHKGPTAAVAARAIEAHPPRDISALLHARGAPTEVLVHTLARLRDQRAFHALRNFVRWAAPPVRGAAALALTQLGDLETVELARHWLKADQSRKLRVPAARILALSHTPDAPLAVAKLLKDDATQDAGLELALQAPHPKLILPLERLLSKVKPRLTNRILGAIGRAGGADAAEVLARQLTITTRAAPAAYALALTAGEAATQALARALQSKATRRLAVRAAVVRRQALNTPVPGTNEALAALLTSDHPADRAAGAWGLAVFDSKQGAALLESKDRVVVRAAARAAFTPQLTTAAARRLSRETDAATQTALSIALVDEAGADLVPTQLLLSLIEGGSGSTPLAARALAARDCALLRPRIEALLENSDAWIRAHTALGLGRSPQRSASGLLDRVYRRDPSATVRRAVVVALSQRPNPLATRTLELAARLDGDAQVREIARMTLGGTSLANQSGGANTFWLSIVSSMPPRDSGRAARAALVLTASGLALPLLADPDGLVTACGLPEGLAKLRIAASAPGSQDRELAEGSASDRRGGTLLGRVGHTARDWFGMWLAHPLPLGGRVVWAAPPGLTSG